MRRGRGRPEVHSSCIRRRRQRGRQNYICRGRGWGVKREKSGLVHEILKLDNGAFEKQRLSRSHCMSVQSASHSTFSRFARAFVSHITHHRHVCRSLLGTSFAETAHDAVTITLRTTGDSNRKPTPAPLSHLLNRAQKRCTSASEISRRTTT